MTQADIESMIARETDPGVKQALEMARRCTKGIPSDRWIASEDEALAVARGIAQMAIERQELADACQALLAERAERTKAAMELSA